MESAGRPSLAAGAEITAPPGDAEALDSFAAARARKRLPAIDTKEILKTALEPVTIPEVPDGSPPELYSSRQNEPYRSPKFFQVFLAKPRNVRFRMDAGLKEDFVGIDIADSGDETLMEKQGLDAAATACKELKKGGKV
jgi:hypothetical protein